MHELAPFLELTIADAAGQWRRIQQRKPAERQEAFLPVETLLAYGLFFVLRPNRYGGGNIGSAPRPVHQLGATCRRTAGSFTNKMLNLDGSREHGQRIEPLLFLRLSDDVDRFGRLYRVVVRAARTVGLTEENVPDFLGLLANSRAPEPLRPLGAVEPDLATVHVDRLVVGYALREMEAAELLRRPAALDEHRFATAVLAAWGRQCAMCGMSPRRVPSEDLLAAVRLHPTAVPRMRCDVGNGLAACPTHGRAIDRRWLWFEDDGRVALGPALSHDVAEDPAMARAFGPGCISPRIDVVRVDQGCLRWHRDAARAVAGAAPSA